MASSNSRRLLVFGDVHIPYHNPVALQLLEKTVHYFRPDILVCLGDLLDCTQFSPYPPVWGIPETTYVSNVEFANKFLDQLQRVCPKLVLIEGNHEYRLARWAANSVQGRGSYSLLAPQYCLTRNRKCKYILYGSANGKYPYYSINSRTVAVHGWSYAKNATKTHLTLSQGKDIIFGHTHRLETAIIQNIWNPSKIIEARNAGCLCKLVPLYGTGRPVEWVNGFVVGYLGRRSDTFYTVPIFDNRCILPDGKEVGV